MGEIPNTTKWGQRPNNPNARWVKVREMVGAPFTLLRGNAAMVNGKASYVFEATDGRLFSVSQEGSAIGKKVALYGLPPAGEYAIEAQAGKVQPNPQNPDGNRYILVAL